jgi:sterol desaturase/sphingolipid hydroxylase (fatty acid hydroxylase superfamily)
VQLSYEITPADHLEMVKVVRASLFSRVVKICLGIVGLALGILAHRYFNHSLGVVSISVFVAFIILQMFLPYLIHRRVYYRNPRLNGMRTVTFDDDGLKSESEIGHVERR